MKLRLNFFLGLCLLGVSACFPLMAQQQAVISVGITQIQVGGVTQPSPNEASGPALTPIQITSTAIGTNLVSSFTHTFYVNGVQIGTNSVPASVVTATWTPPQPGAYALSVKATDGTNTATSFPVRYFATGTQLISPLSGTLVPNGSSVVIKADATPAGGFIQRIDFYADGALIGSDTSAPYSIIYTPPSSPSAHTIEVRAFDNNNAQVSVNGTATTTINTITPIGALPTSSIASPVNGSSVAIPNYVVNSTASIPVTVSANDSDGTLGRVELYIDGVLFGTSISYPYTYDWRPQVIGTYRLVALAFDDKNNVTASSPSIVTISSPPIVTITAPAASATVNAGSPVQVVANASDSDGSITSVQFFADGVLIADKPTAPYSVAWTPSVKADGTATLLTALATDNVGLTTLSTAVSVTVTGPGGGSGGAVIGVAPTVAVTSPTAGTALNVAAPVSLTANADDTDGNIKSVQFLANGTSIGSDSSYPYGLTWTPTSLGTYTIVARATDNDGNIVNSTAVVVTVIDPAPGAPAVSITGPAAASVLAVGSAQTITANASASTSIASVQFYANGQPIGSATRFPYSTSWTPNSPGSYVLTARVTDDIGKQTTSAPVSITVTGGVAPTVALTGPTSGTTIPLGSGAQITANASDSDGSVTLVQFFANGVLLNSVARAPYSLNWVPGGAGAYVLTAVATDNIGNTTTSASVSVTVTSGAAPIVAITNPVGGSSSVVGNPISVNVNASATNGTVAQVQFLVNGIPLSVTGNPKLIPPYIFSWTPAAVGTYSLTAIATDSAGFITNSAAVNVAVTANQPPTVNITSPTSNLAVNTGVAVTVTADAIDVDGSVSSVRFLANGALFGTVATSAPYKATFTPSAAGSYSIVAQATDNSGNVTNSTPVTVTAGSTGLPSVILSSPAESSLDLDSTIFIAADAVATIGSITRVQFFANNTLLATRTAPPYTYVWAPNSPGVYSIRAVAIDTQGNSVSTAGVAITLLPTSYVRGQYSVTLVSPANNTTIVAFRNLTYLATTNLSAADNPAVDFYRNGVKIQTVAAAPFQFTQNPSAAGTYEYVAVVRSNGFTAVSAPATVTVLPNKPPTVTVTSPTSGTSVTSGSRLTIRASATDSDDLIDNIKFLVNGQVISTAQNFPYTADWTPTAEGIYTVTAIAKDSLGSVGGNQTQSDPVYVRVAGAPGTSASSAAIDTVYSGTYAGGSEFGKFAVISLSGKSAVFIAHSTTGSAKNYFYSGLSLDASGGFTRSDSGKTTISGRVNATGVSGSFDSARLTFIGPITFASTSKIASGYYTGNLGGRPASTVVAIVGADGSIMAYVNDGGFTDVGDSTVDSLGRFTIATASGNTLAGTASPDTGFLTGTLTGGPGGAFTGALTSGSTFSDGFLRNLSTRGQVGSGSDILIAGFVVSGGAPKQVLVRAIGPSLTQFGITGALSDPQVSIFNGGTLIASNDNWSGNSLITAASAQVGAFPLLTTSLDAVVLTTLAPGAYTAQVSGTGGKTGVSLVELYDVDTLTPFSAQKLMNVSTRGVVGSGQSGLIAGFVVTGNSSKKLLIRGIGPTLGTSFGVAGALADPVLQIIGSGNKLIRENDNWETGNEAVLIADAATKVGAFPLASGSKDAVLLVSLPPGTYSAVVSGVGGTTGVGLVEVYEVP